MIIYIKYSKAGKKAGSQHLNDVMKKELPKLLLTAYCVGIIAVTVFRYFMIGEMGFDPASRAFRFSVYWKTVFSASRVNLVPFKTIGAYFSFLNASGRNDTIHSISLVNLLGNILVFCPLGVLLPVVFPRYNSVWKILAAGAAFSFMIEFVQFFVGRSSDIDDIIFNTLGVVLGFWIYRIFRFFHKTTISK